jgi:pilus assembly protein CpaF
VSLVARGVNVEGAGGIDLRELVRQSLRMRGDRLVVGEFRGAEVVELLAALNTGHPGGAATVHANSVRDVPARLTALAALGGMPAHVLQVQASSALDLLVHVGRDRSGQRAVREVAVWSVDVEAGSQNVVWSADQGWRPRGSALRTELSDRVTGF